MESEKKESTPLKNSVQIRNNTKTKKTRKKRCPNGQKREPITKECIKKQSVKAVAKQVEVKKTTDFIDFALLNTNEQITFIRENDTRIVDNIYDDLVNFSKGIDTSVSKNDTRNIDKQQVNSALEVLLGIIDNPERNPYEIKERAKLQQKYIPKPSFLEFT